MNTNLKDLNVIQDNRGNLIAQLKSNTSDIYFLWADTERCTFTELKNTEEEPCVIRAYGIDKRSCILQFRTTQALTRNGKERRLLATAHFFREDLEYLLHVMNTGNRRALPKDRPVEDAYVNVLAMIDRISDNELPIDQYSELLSKLTAELAQRYTAIQPEVKNKIEALR